MRGLRIHVASNPRMDIHFNCPRCGQKLSVEGSGVGLIVNCPVCEAEIEIPPGTAPQPNVSVPTIPQTLPQQRPSQSELDNVSRGSIVKVSDPDKHVCYWVIIERRLKNHHFFGRIDPRCMMSGPALRHGGRLTFHQDHISYIWAKKVDQVFDSAWFRHLSHVLSFRAGAKVLKRPTSGSVRRETRLTDRIK